MPWHFHHTRTHGTRFHKSHVVFKQKTPYEVTHWTFATLIAVYGLQSTSISICMRYNLLATVLSDWPAFPCTAIASQGLGHFAARVFQLSGVGSVLVVLTSRCLSAILRSRWRVVELLFAREWISLFDYMSCRYCSVRNIDRCSVQWLYWQVFDIPLPMNSIGERRSRFRSFHRPTLTCFKMCVPLREGLWKWLRLFRIWQIISQRCPPWKVFHDYLLLRSRACHYSVSSSEEVFYFAIIV